MTGVSPHTTAAGPPAKGATSPMTTGKLTRISAIAALGAALVVTASACSTSSSGGGSGSSGVGKVGYSESFLTDPFQVQLVKQISQQAKTQGVDVLPATNANNDPG